MKKLVLRKAVPATTGGRSYRLDYQGELNPQQYAAVMHTDGPALVLAGAGTGKTRTLTYRVARLIEDGVDPASILLLTFTRKAAAEMVRRASALLDGRCDKVAGGTFHAVAWQIIQRFRTAGGTPAVSILDQSDAEDVLNLVRNRFDVARLKRRFPQKAALYGMYSRSVNTTTPLATVIEDHYPTFAEQTDRIAEVLRAYNVYKADKGLLDYDDLLLRFLAATSDATTGPVLRRIFRHVMVDEYQDTNPLQHAIVLGLAGRSGNVMVVGDDAQSIYGFRGADVRNIHAVPDTFDPCRIYRLEQNYRSTQPILDVCNAVLRDAPAMFEKELTADRTGGDPPMLVGCMNERLQSQFIVQDLLERHEAGMDLASMAMLVRSGFLSFDLEIELTRANIPFRKVGGLKFAEAAHVKDLLALVRTVVNPRDSIAWYRLLLLLDGVGPRTAEQIVDLVAGEVDVVVADERLPARGRQAVGDLLALVGKARQHQQVVATCLDVVVPWYRTVLELRYDDAARRWKDIETVVAIASRYPTAEAFLADVALEPPQRGLDEADADDGTTSFVTISTIHSAKGLEWDTVYLPWVNEGRIPSARSMGNPDQVEEERRLLYVACTRARNTLVLTYPMVMFQAEHADVVGRPSRFLQDIGEEHLPQYSLSEYDDNDGGGNEAGLPPAH